MPGKKKKSKNPQEKKTDHFAEPEQKPQNPFDQLKQAAEKGDAGSQYLLGERYMIMDLNGDAALALLWFERAAAQEHPRAQARLGMLRLNQIVARHQSVERINQDKGTKEALLLLAKAGKKGDKLAQKYLGLCFYHGWGVKKVDYKKALDLLEGVEDADAQLCVGRIKALTAKQDQAPKDFKLLEGLRKRVIKQPIQDQAQRSVAEEEEELAPTDEEDFYEGDPCHNGPL